MAGRLDAALRDLAFYRVDVDGTPVDGMLALRIVLSREMNLAVFGVLLWNRPSKHPGNAGQNR
ncbi:hypothetical protein R5W23_001241 [Gemmata sp. JC673]|uniref:Uncharacterized protein n=1 Tax=Gemmata algarum TaxID=2975278 RepID=A0ABU5EWV0_9BACT|nr:hypothetical protein [Gemmata algarum]MDY3558191.1 hypothetical protein [Gemmata algarum]